MKKTQLTEFSGGGVVPLDGDASGSQAPMSFSTGVGTSGVDGGPELVAMIHKKTHIHPASVWSTYLSGAVAGWPGMLPLSLQPLSAVYRPPGVVEALLVQTTGHSRNIGPFPSPLPWDTRLESEL